MTSLIDRWSHIGMNNYGAPQLAFVKGEGAVLTAEDGKRYVDFLGGIAVNALGHAHPAVVEAVTTQIQSLGHVSNFYVAEPAVALAELLLALAGRSGRVIFGNSGAEANEAAFKLSRLTGRTHVVSTHGAFHGRTMGALALTGQPSKADPFRPLPGEVEHIAFGDLAALDAAVTDRTAMVITVWSSRPPATWPGRVRSAPGTGRCWSSTRCRPGSGAPGTGSTTRARASSPT
jgi:acetylornithine/N-succinyldiaminopimelate aminotransferase